jgi:hypothetical protein
LSFLSVVAVGELDFDGRHILAAYDRACFDYPQPGEVAKPAFFTVSTSAAPIRTSMGVSAVLSCAR